MASAYHEGSRRLQDAFDTRRLADRLDEKFAQRGFIDADWGTSVNNRRARFYRLTRKGRRELVQEESEWRKIAKAIMRVLGQQSS